MIFWIVFVIFNLQNCYMVAVMTMCLKKRFRSASLWRYILVFEACTIVQSYFRFAMPPHTQWWNICYYSSQLFFILFVAIGFKDYIWKKVMWFVAYLCITSLVELLVNYLITTVFKMQILGTWRSINDLIYMATSNIFLFVVTIIPLIWWKREHISVGEKGKMLVPMVMMPCSQCIMLDILLRALHRCNIKIPDAAVYIIGLCVIADVTFLLILIRQEEIAGLKLKLKELEHAWDLEKAYYEDLEKKERAVSKVRHDIKNQIAVMSHLLEAGEHNKVKEMKRELMEQI